MTDETLPQLYRPIKQPLPAVPVDDIGQVCWRFDEKWRPYIIAFLKALAVKRTWASEGERCVNEAQNLLTDLMLANVDCMTTPAIAEVSDNQACIDYPPSAKFIEWHPNDPIREPNKVYPGFLHPFWSLVGFMPIQIDGFNLREGDVFTQVNVLPNIEELPEVQEVCWFRINLIGAGEVELEFVKWTLGGSVNVVIDGAPLLSEGNYFIELQQDFTSLPPETDPTAVEEIKFTNYGTHTIDCYFYPNIDVSSEFVRFGGGLRRVTLCGFPKQVWDRDGVEFDGEELMGSLCEALRFNDEGKLQAWCCGEWVDIEGQSGPASARADQGAPDGELAADGCTEYSVVLRGNDRWILPVPAEGGYTIEIAGATGGWSWSGGFGAWQCPSGQAYQLGFCGAAGAAAGAGFPVPTMAKGRLIAKIGEAYYDAYNTTIIVPSGQEQTDVFFQMNDDDLTDNHGSVAFNVTVCATSSVVQSLQLDANSETAVETTFDTDIAKLYRITVSGTFNQTSPYKDDAFYFTTDNWATHGRNDITSNSCGGAYLELYVNNAPVSPTPDYAADHVYTFYKQGTGDPFSFELCDSVHADNSGTFTILVEAL